MNAAEQQQLSVIPEISQDSLFTTDSSSDTFVGGSQTYSSVTASRTHLSTSTASNVLDAIIVNRDCTDDSDGKL